MYHLSTEFETVAHDSAGSESFSSLYTVTLHMMVSFVVALASNAGSFVALVLPLRHAVHARPTAVLLSAPRHPFGPAMEVYSACCCAE
jgi:hypothetical protein